MTDHADTIRRAIMVALTATGDAYTHDEYDAAHASLDALLAERQQAIDERDKLQQAFNAEVRVHGGTTKARYAAERRCEQAIDALREAERELPFTQAKLQLQAEKYRDVPLDSCIRDIEHVVARIGAALLSLREQP